MGTNPHSRVPKSYGKSSQNDGGCCNRMLMVMLGVHILLAIKSISVSYVTVCDLIKWEQRQFIVEALLKHNISSSTVVRKEPSNPK